ERRAGGGLEPGLHRVGDDLGQRGLAQAGRTAEEQVVHRLPPAPRAVDQELELLLHALLPYEVREGRGPQRDVELPILGIDGRSLDQAIVVHPQRPTFWSAARSRSSTGRPSDSTPESASPA